MVQQIICRMDLKELGNNTIIGTPIHYCINKSILDTSLIKKLLAAGCDPNNIDHERRTPLHLAFIYFAKDNFKFKEISDLLLKYG